MKKDEKWKNLISKYLEDFLSFFMPELYKEVDFDKGYEFLDGELNKIKIKSDKVRQNLPVCCRVVDELK